MKRIIFNLLLALPALFLASCDNDDSGLNTPPATGTNGDIAFEIGFAPQTRVSTGADFKSAWEAGDAIGLYAVRHSGSGGTLAASGNYIHNVKLTYSSGAWTQATTLDWPSGSDVLDFYAYYPYDASATDPTNIVFNVSSDQRTTSNYNLSDLLTAKADNSGSGWAIGSIVPLTFAHALAMVQVTIDDSKYKALDFNEDISVKLRNVLTETAFDLGNASGPTASGNAQDITMYRVEQSGDANFTSSFTFRALLPAQSLAAGTSIFRIINENLLLNGSTLSGNVVMAAGQAETFTQQTPYTALPLIAAAGKTFSMGQTGIVDATPVHDVSFTKDFRMSKYLITKTQYAVFLNAVGVGENRQYAVPGYGTQTLFTVNQYGWTPLWNSTESRWEASGNTPMIQVNWYGALAYALWAGGALPTEAQWEYACRAGTTTAYSFGDDANELINYAWYFDNAGKQPHPVGEKQPNPWGLYDMHGNVWEWCSDWYSAYGNGPDTDPIGATSGIHRMFRGGSWLYNTQICLSAYRDRQNPITTSGDCGFRVVFVP